MSFKEDVVFFVKENSYRIYFVGMTKTKPINLMKRSDLDENCTGINYS